MPSKVKAALLREAEVQVISGLGHSSLYAAMRDGRFPRPVRVGPRTVRWVATEVDAFIKRRIAERDATQAT
ncbi:AlpA family phage regulatory protein [Ramlibacter henchirensis]|uniref:AlpA family phage regulatory protein n=1 Tax=Ramlibacter henchirensis TaxID=204072 RepID=A0A4Z0BUK6_9BURK|nr:AlpA family phage regulatory protein [Ramlibacter henchirensis]